MSLFDKFKTGLSLSSLNLSTGIKNIFSIKKLTENDVNIKFKEGCLNIKIDESLNISMTGPVSDIKHTKLEI